MNTPSIPSLKNVDEFHKWCLYQAPAVKLEALVKNWDALIGGPCSLKPTSASFSQDRGVGSIIFDTSNEKQRTAVRTLQSLFQLSISNSNLEDVSQLEGEDRLVVGNHHGYLSSLLGLVCQYRHMLE
jgi:hypothetical protein